MAMSNAVGRTVLFTCVVLMACGQVTTTNTAVVAVEKQEPVYRDPLYKKVNKQIMDNVYSGITGFGVVSPQEKAFIEKGYSTKKTSIYGEIPYDSLQVILDNERFGPNDIFYDLGSGVGKVVTQVYLNTPVKKAVGIELSGSRHAGAVKMLKNFKQTDAYNDRKRNGKTKRTLAFAQQDFLKANINDATIIYMCSTCFPPELMTGLIKKFQKINRQGLRIITLKVLPDYENNGFRFERRYKLPMSWSKQSNVSAVYVYSYVGDVFK
jgi:hypothetical protein